MSILSRPQKEWDEFLEKGSRPGRSLRDKALLWVVIPAGILIVTVLCYRFLGA